MELELPSQRNCFIHLIPHNFGMFKPDKITFGLG